MPQIASVAEWKTVHARLRSNAPEAFAADGRVLNLLEGDWKEPGVRRHYESPVDWRQPGSPAHDRAGRRQCRGQICEIRGQTVGSH
jgi:hypothetical protein